MSTPTRVPAIEGWFTMDAHRPALVASAGLWHVLFPADGVHLSQPGV